MDQAPADTELRNIIDKLAQFVARNGPEFEQMTKNKQKDNPKFSFLFGGEYFNYYQYKVTTEQAILKQKGINQMQNADPRLNISQQQQQQPPVAVNNVGIAQNNGLNPVNMGPGNNPPILNSGPPPNAGHLPGHPNAGAGHLSGLPNASAGHLAGSQNSVNRSSGWLQSELANLQSQQTTLQDQVRQSEQNLAAQHAALIAQQQGRVEDAVRQAQENTLQTSAQTTNTDLPGFDAVLQPIIDSCTKDSISAGKAWILQNSTSLESNQVVAEHLLKRVIQETVFNHKLHIIYLVNDVLHHCARKKSLDLRKAMESVVVPMFCNASLAASEEQLNKLNKLLSLWESKSNYFEEGIIDKLKNPSASWADYQSSVMSQHASAISSIAATTKQTFDNYQAQHQAFVNHAMRQIRSIEQQKAEIDLQLKAPASDPLNQRNLSPHGGPPQHQGPLPHQGPPPVSQLPGHPVHRGPLDGPPHDDRGPQPYGAPPRDERPPFGGPPHKDRGPHYGGPQHEERGLPYGGPPHDERGPSFGGPPHEDRVPPFSGPPRDDRGPPYSGQPSDDRGPPYGGPPYGGPPSHDDRGGPPYGGPPPHDDRGGPHYGGRDDRGPPYGGPPHDDRGPPYGGPPHDDRGPPYGVPPRDDRGPYPPHDDRGPPYGVPPRDDRGPYPPHDDRGLPYGGPRDDRGPPYGGPLHDDRGPPYGGPGHDDRGPPFRGPPRDDRGPPYGGPPRDGGPPYGGQLHDDRGPPYGGPPHEDRGPPYGGPHHGGPPHHGGGPHQGPPHGSPPHGGMSHVDYPPHRGPPISGSPHGVPPYGPHGGPPHGGPPHGPSHGPPRDMNAGMGLHGPMGHGGPPMSGPLPHGGPHGDLHSGPHGVPHGNLHGPPGGDQNFSQPPPNWNMTGGSGPGLSMPDFSKPPPGFGMPQGPPPLMSQEICMEDLTPSMPYFELPAGLMVPLIKLEDCEYKPLDADTIRLPPPAPPSDRLLAAVEAFYALPNHDSPRDSDGWEKLGLYEYYRAKNAARKRKEEDIKLGLRQKSKSPSPILRPRSKSPSPPKKRYRSKSRRRSRSKSRERRSRSRSPPPTPNHRRNNRPNHAPRNRRRRNSGKGGGGGGGGGDQQQQPPPTPDRRLERSERSPTPPSFLGSMYSKAGQDTSLDESNKGHQLLRKMGWGGAGLGANEQGIEAPISGGEVRDRVDQYKGVGVNLNDPYENFRKSKGQAFITRMKARAEERAEERGDRGKE